MKLIIDIPELDYECAKQRWMRGNDAHKMDYYISKGTPLDDVKAENKGEWIIYGFPSSEQIKNCTENYYCSECKFVVSRFESRACNYCPNCGADMRGE